MPTTSNFGWTTPADTDLVKDGAAAIRTLGNGIDTSFIDLKGGTTGQVLSKASNTDLDYSWVTPNVGDITEVQAGTGISVASGTGPIPVVTNTVATAYDAKGDLIVGTGADTFARLAVGATNGHTLQVDSSTATGLKWAAAAAAGGKLLQVVSTTKTNTFTSTTANTWVDVTGLSVTITPTANTSKIYVMVSAMMATNAGGGFNYGRVLRDAQVLNVGDSANNRLSAGFGGMSPTADICAGFGYATIDEPATTSATTYKVQIYAQAGVAAAYINRSHTDGNTADYARLVSTITVFEIGA